MKWIVKAGGVLFLTLLSTTALALKVGEVAPDFTAPSTHGEITLSESLRKGPVVLAFYTADFTPRATRDMKAFDELFFQYEKIGANIMGISGDRLDSHWDFTAELGLSFLLISDDGSLKKLYGKGRITYLVDKSGVIRYVHKGQPDPAGLLKRIKALQ